MDRINEVENGDVVPSTQKQGDALRRMCAEERLIYAIQMSDADLFCDVWRDVDLMYQDKEQNTIWHWLVLATQNENRVAWARALDIAYPDSPSKDIPNRDGFTPLQLLLRQEQNWEMVAILRTPASMAAGIGSDLQASEVCSTGILNWPEMKTEETDRTRSS